MVKKTKDSISVGLIVFGAFVAGARDMSYESYGYVIVLLANLATAIYLATIARVGKIYILPLLCVGLAGYLCNIFSYLLSYQENPVASTVLV